MNKSSIGLLSLLGATLLLAFYLLNAAPSSLSQDNGYFVYSEDTAQSLAALSMAAYCKSSKIEQWSCGTSCKKTPAGVTDVVILKNSTMYSSGFVGYSKESQSIVVVFRGTVPWLIQNWITDLDAIKTKYPLCNNGCSVHLGFFKAFKEIEAQLIKSFTVLKAKYPNSKVQVTGHSLGGALSTLAMPIVYQLNGNKKIDAFYNFGSPRVGDDAYHDWFTEQDFSVEYGRITHFEDPVPHLPTLGFPFYYTHIDHEIYYKSFKKPFVKCEEAENMKCADGVKLPISVPDHLTYFGWDWAVDILACQ